jgi:hypothetical protein
VISAEKERFSGKIRVYNINKNGTKSSCKKEKIKVAFRAPVWYYN